MTLDRLLSRYGVSSRSAASEMIRAGRVTVNGRVANDPLQWVEPATDTVRLDGKRLKKATALYYALHKPKGYITSHGDPQGRPTVYDLIAKALNKTGSAEPRRRATGREANEAADASAARKWLFPVGRLDQDTTGLLLLTNDSIFAERITNPLTKVPKTYLVKVNTLLQVEEMQRLRDGLDIGRGERTGPAQATWIRDNGRFCWIELRISEGKNRQVRRMIEALGHTVLKLTRTRIGKLSLGDLAPGELRPIQPSDVL